LFNARSDEVSYNNAPAITYRFGEIAEGFFTFHDGLVCLTDAVGNPLPGNFSTRLSEGELPLGAARQLLRQQRSLNRHARFNRPLPHKPWKVV
jgi:hypothetical protein